MNLNIALAQIKVVSGDLNGNTNRILEGIQKAINENVDIVVFPELSVSGYNIGVLFEQQHFIDCESKFVNDIIIPYVPSNLVVILGCINYIGKNMDGSPNITNASIIIQNGKVLSTYSKIFLAGKNHHEDFRYFSSGEHTKVTKININNQIVNLGVVICEDMWYFDHQRDIVHETVNSGAELIISINQSYFYYGKQEIRRQICMNHALKNKVPFLSCNSSGVGDAGAKNMIVYDGGSIVVDSNGKIVNEAKRFDVDFLITNINSKESCSEIKLKPYNKFEEIYNAIVYAQREIFKDLGFKKAMVCVSGGLDSSVTLPIVVDAMGVENVYALSMPSKYNGDITKLNAQHLCDSLGVKLYWEEMYEIQKAYINAHSNAFGNSSLIPLNISTFDAVGRTVAGIAASQSLNAGLVSTSNHTEIVLNWFSWHDISTAAVYGPLADLSKVEIFELAKYINLKFEKEIIPINLIDGTTLPNPELADATQGAKWNYFIVSGICCLLIRDKMDIENIIKLYVDKNLPSDYFPLDFNGQSIYDLVLSENDFRTIVKMCFEKQKKSVYKASQACGMLMLSKTSRNFSNHESMINHYKGSC